VPVIELEDLPVLRFSAEKRFDGQEVVCDYPQEHEKNTEPEDFIIFTFSSEMVF
jgi:hypothetical protein